MDRFKTFFSPGRREKAKLWRNFGRQSLTIKLAGAVSAVVCLVIGAGTVVLMDVTRREIAETSVATALYQTQLLKSKLTESLMAGGSSAQDLDFLLKDLQKTSGLNEASIFGDDGQVIASTIAENKGKAVELPPKKVDRETADGALVAFLGTGKSGKLRIIHPIVEKISGQLIGGIELFVPLAPIYKRFGVNNFFFIFLALTLIVLIALLIRWLVHRIVKRPLNKLMKVMERAERGELEVRTSIREDPELRRLAKSFNMMVRGIQTAQKKIESQHRKELAQSNRLASLGQFISTVSHEIKNPLAAVSSALHVLRNEFRSAEGEAIFQELSVQLVRIERTVNNLLRYARQAPPNFESCRILNPIQHALRIAHDRFIQARIHVKIEPDSSRLNIEADEGQLEQVFLNLFLNAADAMKSGGLLKVRIQPAMAQCPEDFSAPPEPVGLKIEVEDTGVGISGENLQRIFEPFFSTKKGGTGLGLSVVKGIVEAHHGSFRVESKMGQGTKIVIFLPLSQSNGLGKVWVGESESHLKGAVS